MSIYSAIHDGAFVVKYQHGKIVAVGGLRNIKTHQVVKRFHHRYHHQNVGALWRVYVDPNHQRQGYGKAVVKELEHRARGLGYKKLYLHTSELNPAAVKFWKQQGFEIFEIDLDDLDKTVHMEKSL